MFNGGDQRIAKLTDGARTACKACHVPALLKDLGYGVGNGDSQTDLLQQAQIVDIIGNVGDLWPCDVEICQKLRNRRDLVRDAHKAMVNAQIVRPAADHFIVRHRHEARCQTGGLCAFQSLTVQDMKAGHHRAVRSIVEPAISQNTIYVAAQKFYLREIGTM